RLTPDDVAGYVRSALGADAPVRACSPLAGGGFAAVWRVHLADGHTVVLKVGPPPGVPLLRYEKDLVAEEARYYAIVPADVPVPRFLHAGPDWHLSTSLPGTPLTDVSGDTATARAELGAAVARLHTVTGERFGYTGDRAHGATWRAAFTAMV